MSVIRLGEKRFIAVNHIVSAELNLGGIYVTFVNGLTTKYIGNDMKILLAILDRPTTINS